MGAVAMQPDAMQTAVMHPDISIRSISKTFGNNRPVLNGISLEVTPGEMVALIGSSGSGKTTLLRHIAGLTAVDADGGEIEVRDHVLQKGGKVIRDRGKLRARIGLVFQQHNLIDRYSVLTNTLLGAIGRTHCLGGWLCRFNREDQEIARNALSRVGMLEHADRRADQLSGGQQQRVAIARTLTQQASIILADEPIASLDPASAERVMRTLSEINAVDKVTMVISLHQIDFALRYCQRVVAMKQGHIIFDGPRDQFTRHKIVDVYGSDAEMGRV
ncbi:phosphonate ABC transporter ATP-binding protein [Dongia soli]|uniref:Phosphonate ABC transporter ATP-binding protein n=1 Tax=Dongia soli TaxID=600628 RepID=A0ABU5ECB5_9PROT|nr:phosphonate ABC transporter ATP-binding protein [Dongia soli]MDY0883434.1 phosphonate ABC transporter ATP-binding protein [Dongia soli]